MEEDAIATIAQSLGEGGEQAGVVEIVWGRSSARVKLLDERVRLLLEAKQTGLLQEPIAFLIAHML